jgi:PAS domain S-box-containing protein
MDTGAVLEFELPSSQQWFFYKMHPTAEAGLSVFFEDITGRKEAEILAARLAAIVDSSDDVIIGKTLDGVITSWNTSAERLFGYTADEAIGQSIMLLIPADRRDEEVGIIERLKRGERVDHFETVRQRKDGSLIDLSLTISPIKDSSGRVVGASKIARDITQRRYAEEALRRSEALSRSVLNNSPDCIKLLDLEGRVRFVNEPGLKLLGICDITPFIGEPWVGFWGDPEHRASAERAIARALRGELTQFEGHFTTFDGRSTWWDVMVTGILDTAGTPSQILALSRDITARRAAQEERERFMQELERSNQELSQFSHMVAHDLQTPVRTIRTFVEILARKHVDDGDEGLRAMILEAAARMQDLIHSLLSYAEVGKGDVRRSLVRVDETLHAARVSLAAMIDENNARIEYAALPTVHADPTLLSQLLQNLMTNAIKYRRADVAPVVMISGKSTAGGWEFAVQDNGQGIPPEFREIIFQPLKRLHGTDIPGTGLGLALCATIVERHGGRIWVQETPGGGATFRFTIPR